MTLTKIQEQAAILLADGKMPDKDIADKIGCSERQLNRWKNLSAFRARQKEHVDAWKERVRNRILALKEGRIDALIAQHAAIRRIVKLRGEQLAKVSGAAGGDTGYIAIDFVGKDAQRPIFVFDSALYREERATLEQIADELGQLVKRHEHTGKDGKAIEVVKRVIGVAEDEL